MPVTRIGNFWDDSTFDCASSSTRLHDAHLVLRLRVLRLWVLTLCNGIHRRAGLRGRQLLPERMNLAGERAVGVFQLRQTVEDFAQLRRRLRMQCESAKPQRDTPDGEESATT